MMGLNRFAAITVMIFSVQLENIFIPHYKNPQKYNLNRVK